MLIFLDIDGVMVHANSWKKPDFLQDGFYEFTKKSTLALQKIISETNGKIVLTTSHKSRFTISNWKQIFSSRGIQVNYIDRLPENENHLNRKDELLNWFNSNNVDDDFFIIDDDKSLNELPEHFKKRLIQTSPSIGLTENLVDEALLLLK
jgi:hypothetical protein